MSLYALETIKEKALERARSSSRTLSIRRIATVFVALVWPTIAAYFISLTTVFSIIALMLYAICFSEFSYRFACSFRLFETEPDEPSFTCTGSMLWKHIATILRADLLPAAEKRKRNLRVVFKNISTAPGVGSKTQLLISEGQQMIEETMNAIESLERSAMRLLEVIETRVEIIRVLEELGHATTDDMKHHLDAIEEETRGVIEIVNTLTSPDSPLLEVAKRYEKESLPETAKILHLPKS